MLKILTVVLFLSGAAVAADAPDLMKASALTAGRYELAIQGMICTVCARAIAAELAKLPDLQKTRVDYEKGRATLVLPPNKTLKLSALLKALRRAEKTANLDARFDLRAIDRIP